MSKDNNLGFSMVEIIIVIAIMAILAAALAPQLMKYIHKSRKTTDYNNCQMLITTANATLGDSDAYKEVSNAVNNGKVSFIVDGNKPTSYSGIAQNGIFAKKFLEHFPDDNWPKVSQDSSKVFEVQIELNEEDKRVLMVDANVVLR